MSEDSDKTLPKDWNSDYSLPGRLEESNFVNSENNAQYFDSTDKPKSKNKALWISIIVFLVFSTGFFAYYFLNQSDIDSQIIQNAMNLEPEDVLIQKYGIGEYGSEHVHAAITVFIDDELLNFALPYFQLSSKYIHFEDHNPYLVHRHAVGVPLDMLFTSFGMKITSDCIKIDFDKSDGSSSKNYCVEKNKSLGVYINGKRYYSDISQYVIKQNDRILISYGDTKFVKKQLEYVESLKIPNVSKKTPQFSGDDIMI